MRHHPEKVESLLVRSFKLTFDEAQAWD